MDPRFGAISGAWDVSILKVSEIHPKVISEKKMAKAFHFFLAGLGVFIIVYVEKLIQIIRTNHRHSDWNEEHNQDF